MPFILGFFDYFLPANMRSNPADLMRGYIFVGLILFNIIVCLLVLAVLFLYLELEEQVVTGSGLNIICLLGNVATLILLKRTHNHALCSNLILGLFSTITFIGVQITGGYFESPILQLMLQLPVMAFLLLGLQRGSYWLGITFLICMMTYVSAQIGWGYVQLLERPDVLQAMYFALQLVLLFIIGGALVIYELINGLLKAQLNEERNRFEHKASHDDLTGIPNRFEFFRRLKAVIEEAEERGHKVGVVYLDLDEFKPINDEHGHHMGDEALRIVTERLQGVLRLSDTTARLGGDEFGLILPGIHVPTDIESIMPKVLAAIREPMSIDGIEMRVRGSCGVAVYPTHSEDHSALCRYADAAMYRAKREQDNYLVYAPEMSMTAS